MQATLPIRRQPSLRALVMVLATAAVLLLGIAAGYLLRGIGPTVSAGAAGPVIVTASGPAVDEQTHRSGIQY